HGPCSWACRSHPLEKPMKLASTCLAAVATSLLAAPVSGQRSEGAVSTPVAKRAADIWNATSTTRTNGAFDLAAGRSVDGSVAVLNGPVTIAGTVRGSIAAINADVRLAKGARIERDLIVVGGSVTGADSASLGGEILQQDELLRYHIDHDLLELDREPE